MRISLEDLKKPEENTAPAEPEEPVSHSKLKKWGNWWYYYKWYVVCGILVLGIIIHVAGDALGLWTKSPDFQIAYIGKTLLPEDTVLSLEQAFASVASDFNHDGEIIVRINQYVDGMENADVDSAYYEYASEITLIGDISNCDSYFFLMEDPNLFQRDYQLLAAPDGSCPDSLDYSTEGRIISWADCSAFSEMELGSYSATVLGETVSGSNQELLSRLYIGRRCFFTDKVTDYASQCSEVWDILYKNS